MRKILIVEDDDALRNLFADELQHEGYNVMRARNGREAMSFILENMPDIVITDLIMPEMSGYELIQNLRHNTEGGKDVPVIVITGQPDLGEMLNEGQVFALLTKPEFNFDFLLETVEKALRAPHKAA